VGKTSLLHSIAGSLKLTSGTILVNDRSIERGSNDTLLVPEFPPPIPWIRAEMLLEFILSLYPDSRKADCYKDVIVARLGLQPFLRMRLGTLSAGTAKKVLLAAALVAAPPILLFDEPTNEIDSDSASVFLNELTQLRNERIAIVTTHHADVFIPLAETVLRLGSPMSFQRVAASS
jgi:ABC-type multidrug transport system ATPase subunit